MENLGNRTVDVDGGMGLLGAERFEGGQLGVEQIRGHELVITAGQVGGDDITRSVEVDEHERGCRGAQQVPVGAFEGGAGDDRGRGAGGFDSDGIQPRSAIGVGQRHTRGHLRFVSRGVEIVGIDESAVESLRHLRAEDGFAGSRDTHDDERRKERVMTHVRNLSIKYEEISIIDY